MSFSLGKVLVAIGGGTSSVMLSAETSQEILVNKRVRGRPAVQGITNGDHYY